MKNESWIKENLLAEYDPALDHEGVSGKRIAERIEQLSHIGQTAEKGSFRPGFSTEEKEAKELVKQWMEEAGLSVRKDGAGNVIGRLEGKNPELPAVMSGSHVDTVPNGGHFDGVLGVLSALEVAQAWKETGYVPEKPYEVVIFTDEEGSRFNGGLNGSEAMMGVGDIEEKKKQRDTEGKSFEEVLLSVGLSLEGFQAAARDPQTIDSFVEVHIEQGKRLEKENLPCGIVTGIAGPHWLKLLFTGKAGHAGNTPMDDRQDALVAAADFISGVHDIPRRVNQSAVATIGKMEVRPNGVNVIPEEVELYVDIRDVQEESRSEVVRQIEALAKQTAQKRDVEVASEVTMRVPPVPVSEERQQLLEKVFEENGIRPYRLPSGAGHDAMIVGKKVPIAMLFVRSKDGVSHNPAEWSDLNDCVQGIHVLKGYVEKIQ